MIEKLTQLANSAISLVSNWESFFASIALAGSAAIIVAILEVVVDKKSTSLAKVIENKKSATIDAIFWIFHFTPLFSIILALSTFGILNVAKIFLHEMTADLMQLEDSVIKFLLLFVAYDLIGYVAHRFMHSNSFTWRFHAFHHSARSFNIMTVHRVHPVDSAVIKFFQTLVALILGATLIDIFWFSFAVLLLGTVKHSNLIVSYPKPFNWIIQSPAQHWVHHSENPDHYDTNFGEILQIWDVLFGTHRDLSKKELKELKIGTPDTIAFHDDLWKLLIWPYQSIFNSKHKSKSVEQNTSE
jgi:sterol desaturase/sphingolipid hydroxylase (fatty acid hydroxylase superfamily)